MNTCGHCGAPLRGAFQIDRPQRMVGNHGRLVILSPQGIILFLALWERAGAFLTRAECRAALWPNPDTEPISWENVLKVIVHRLRKRLHPLGIALDNKHGVGYRVVLFTPSEASR